jgi:hypothetical protein
MLLELGRLLRSARNDEVFFTHLSLLYYLVCVPYVPTSVDFDNTYQVFATTHSQDCVQAFGEIWNKIENQKEGNYIRLQRNRLDSTIIEPVYYDSNVLLGSIYDNLEIR